ncbi:TPA: hypothetical protein ACSVPQ_002477 [Clostridioides difficile]|nr:hypothetical protein [Clostridioides difficile]MCW0772755.1 hypothetical protein [Clostridioides difficile]MDI2978642.1 hypothetical protein [Clostridioides difficile]MDI3075270.1 hypothetical protein [Clostridioides difficile]MDI6151643.1 hypothetical protein [Clostridioides difficile]MDI7828039.1 hypothetical protein [Clostridioides difficile]
MEMTQYEFDLAMVKEDGVYIMNVQKQSYEMCIEAVRNNKEAILYIRWDELNLTKEQKNNIYLEVIEDKRQASEYINELTGELYFNAVKQDGGVLLLVYIMNVQKQNYEMCLEAVKNSKEAILYIRWDELNLTKEQKNNIYLEAVRNDGLSLEYIEEQTEEICIEAIRQANQAILFVKNMTKNIYLESIA